jgi:hypothetical protein
MQTLNAHAHVVNVQTTNVRSWPMRRYGAPMQPEQKIIAEWMARQLADKGWTGDEWAKRAGVSPSTVTRAQSDTYPSVTAVLTLDKLAKAAGVPSILSYLEDDTPPTIPSEEVLTVLLSGMLRGLSGRFRPEEMPLLLARGLQSATQLLARNPAILANPEALAATAEALTLQARRPGTDK